VVGALRMMQRWNFASILVEVKFGQWDRRSLLIWVAVPSTFWAVEASVLGRAIYRGGSCQVVGYRLRTIQLFDPDLINLSARDYLPGWFHSVREEDEDEERGEEEIREKDSAKREADGVVPGEGEAKESVLEQSSGVRDSSDSVNGVG
jgi:hypothetical protein